MALVAYSDSEDESEETTLPAARKGNADAAKDEKVNPKALPALPNAFRDLYSSTVRTSTQDDPALHGGRKRVMPHVEGNWPAHVYLEWHPQPQEAAVLSDLLEERRAASPDVEVKCLLHNELGVSLPLHVSLSRPLTLQTSNKDAFLARLKSDIASGGLRAFNASPLQLRWHPNETSTRWFMVLQLQKPAGDELSKLLAACNKVAEDFVQPMLYVDSGSRGSDEGGDKFHISIAWSLKAPATSGPDDIGESGRFAGLDIGFSEVKIRIGQAVTAIPLQPARKASARRRAGGEAV